MKIVFITALLMLTGLAKTDVAAQTLINGKVIQIVDGDTYDILLQNHTTRRIRMEGIDAPERGMPFYRLAKNYLGTLCFGLIVSIEQTGTDRYGRMIAKTYLHGGNELGLLMVAAGYAWHFKKYSTDIQLANAEIKARHQRVGLWADKAATPPWDLRKRKYKKHVKIFSRE